MSGPNGGFTVDPARLAKLIVSTGEHSGQVRRLLNALLSLPAAVPQIWGDGGVVDAYLQFHRTWTGELSIVAGGMEQISTTLAATNRAYATVDTNSGGLFRPQNP